MHVVTHPLCSNTKTSRANPTDRKRHVTVQDASRNHISAQMYKDLFCPCTLALITRCPQTCERTQTRRKPWLIMRIRSALRFGRGIWVAHLHFLFSFSYIFIFVEVEWCVEPQCATDPSPDLTEMEHPAYPTINAPFFPCVPTLRLPWGLMEIVLPWFHFALLVIVGCCAFVFQFCWWQDDRQKAGKHLRHNWTRVCERRKSREGEMQRRRRKKRVELTGGRRTWWELSLFNQILAGGWFVAFTFTNFVWCSWIVLPRCMNVNSPTE